MSLENITLQKNDKVIIHLITDHYYEGVVVLNRKNSILLRNAFRIGIKKPYLTVLLFDKKQIVKIIKKVPNIEKERIECYVNLLQNKTTLENNYESPKSFLDPILDMIHKYVIISENDSNYEQFLKDLSACRFVGISNLGFINGRMSNPSLIAFNLDGKRIVVLDLIELKSSKINPFKLSLKSVLKSNKIEKVIHCSKFFVDYLIHGQNICISNIFDTHVASVYLNEEDNQNAIDNNMLLSYNMCLVKYFKFPEDFYITHIKHLVLELKRKLYKRPLDKSLVHFLLYNAAFLIPLRHQLYSLITKPLWEHMDEQINSFCGYDIDPHEYSNSTDFV